MPVINQNLDVNVRISVSAHFLKKARAPQLLFGRFNFNAPGLRFEGVTASRDVDHNGKVMFNVVLDELPDHTLRLFGTSLKYAGPRVPLREHVNVSNIAISSEEGNLDDAEVSEEEDKEEPVNDEVWTIREVSVDERLASV
ncbi:hypothetical protein INT48_005994 [Thamnidium elegans]|uniref:Uncharacterized protein n=1 Tax=Thamnidium elegans TaxID=101142 RepID=A0A8H7SP40_9FUNG|nr:hypothetical protein INT48_005994 [Thamnidium elegans]